MSFGARQFRWRFLLAEVAFPLLGVDSLHHFLFSVNLSQFTAVDAVGNVFMLQEPPAGCAAT
jgi:hypothetical protein